MVVRARLGGSSPGPPRAAGTCPSSAQYARAGLRAREVNVKVTKHMRSYLSPESLAVCRQLNSEWLRDIEDELRESRAALRAREDTPSASAV